MERGHPLQAAHAGGAHRHHPPPSQTRRLHGRHQLLRHLHPLAVQLQSFQPFLLQGPEGAQPHVQRHRGPQHTPLLEALQEGIAEMQSGGGGGDGAGLGGIARLVAIALHPFRPVDVGRQGDRSIALKEGLEAGGIPQARREANHPPPGFGVGAHHLEWHGWIVLALRGLQLQHLPKLHPPGRLEQAEPIGPLPLGPGLQHQHLHGPAARPPSPQPCLQHPSVVHHHQISRPELLRPVPHLAVAGSLARPHDQQPGTMAGLYRPLGDGLRRQGVVVAGEQPVLWGGHGSAGRFRGPGSQGWFRSAGPAPAGRLPHGRRRSPGGRR